MIDFEIPPPLKMVKDFTHGIGRDTFRPISRKYDEQEHTTAEELAFLAPIMSQRSSERRKKKKKEGDEEGPKEPRAETEDRVGATMTAVIGSEEMCWGDCGLMLAIPGNGLGNAAISAVATPEQEERFGGRFAAMAITEPGSGSDSGSIATTAV